MRLWAEGAATASAESSSRLLDVRRDAAKLDTDDVLREGLLDFIADFSDWDRSKDPFFIDTARTLTELAHEGMGNSGGTRPLVVDPFAGGGSIPLEALRCGADAFASDVNPVPVLLNKVLLEYVPRHGAALAQHVRECGEWIRRAASKELEAFYPRDPDGAVPIAYLWARTISCEGPACGAKVPLMRSMWLGKRKGGGVALRQLIDEKHKRIDFEIIERAKTSAVQQGTVSKGKATCPVCKWTTPVASVRRQLKTRAGGTQDARLFAVVTERPGYQGRTYRLPIEADVKAARAAAQELKRRAQAHRGTMALVPDEEFSGTEPRRIPLPMYGMSRFGDLFTGRQALALTTLVRLCGEAVNAVMPRGAPDLRKAVLTCLALIVDRQSDYLSSLTIWSSTGEFIAHTFGRQALPMVWEWPECNPWAGGSGNYEGAVDWVVRVIEANTLARGGAASVALASATQHPLPDNSADAIITDPPYYYSVPYSDLSDFFYVWLRRVLGDAEPALFSHAVTDKSEECVQNLPHSEVAHLQKDRAFFERQLTRALVEARRVAKPEAIATVVFAHSETEAWEALLGALVSAGWVVTASWPIDTERAARVIAQRQSTLTSSIHLLCRPREHGDGTLRVEVGAWRDVLSALPLRIKEWLPRLSQEGVVGADAIFACLGPALEVFSRYARVEKASGEAVALREYLEQVWAAVSREALSMLFASADAAGLEADARVTAIWLWTLARPTAPEATADDAPRVDSEPEVADEASEPQGAAATAGFRLEYDAARKIAQGLGARLDELTGIVEVSGDAARLLSVSERTGALFGRHDDGITQSGKAAKRKQLTLFSAIDDAAEAEGWRETGAPKLGTTTLDRVHQAMLLFGAGRTGALTSFIREQRVGGQTQFWKLAQALSALYPVGCDEKRWIDGVLSKKKGLGFG